MPAGQEKKKKCETIIPFEWPQMTGPASTGHVAKDKTLWFDHLRNLRKITPTPRIYRHGK